jgi:dephospho-CoA kinase
MKEFQELQEGLQDPHIFKAFFLAGGPGSGKSFVVRKTTGGTGLRIVNSDDMFEKYLKDAGLSQKMPETEAVPREKLRKRSKVVAAKRQDNYVKGRIGLIIDGTGKEYDKIAAQSIQLKQLGYETHMIFVNTSLDVALIRNAERPRSVPEKVAVDSWKSVQSNIGKFSQHFRQNMIIVDNNNTAADDGQVFNDVFKQIKGLLKKNVRNPAAHAWVSQQMKERGITRKPKGW